MTKLRISPTLSLSDDIVTKTVAILAQRRKGKTYTASVMAEEMVRAKVPFVALDPTGAWWGLRASADGKEEGLPVVILGGQHGDIPLERSAGRFIADLVLDNPGWYVIDFSLFESGAAERQFATDFAERLYRRKGQPEMDFPMHLIVDEADRFVPQRVGGGKGEARETDQRMLGAFEAIVRRGGLRGLGTTLISQRAAVVNKNVLEQIDILIMLRIVGPNDRRAIEDNLQADADADQRKILMGSLGSLDIGEAWLWEPGGEPPLFDRIRIRERKTFNSSATPKLGQKRIEPRRFAEVDLAEIKEAMAETIERAQADDPKVLHRRIAELEREVTDLENDRPEPEIVEVEVQAVSEEMAYRLETAVASLGDMLAEIGGKLAAAAAQGARAEVTHLSRSEIAARRSRAQAAPMSTTGTFGRPMKDLTYSGTPLGAGEQKVLSVLATYPQGRSHGQLALLTGYSPKASTVSAILSKLRAAGLVEPGSPPRATPAGIAAAGDVKLPRGDDLLEYWRNHRLVGGGGRKVLDILIERYPAEVHKDELCDLAGYSRQASTVSAIMSVLRKLELVQGWRAAPDFIEAIA